jgi:hypothetical protein
MKNILEKVLLVLGWICLAIGWYILIFEPAPNLLSTSCLAFSMIVFLRSLYNDYK